MGRVMRRIALACLVAVAGAAAASTADGPREDVAPESPQQLLERAFRNLYGDDFVQVMTLSTRRAQGTPMVRRLQVTRKQSVRPGKSLVRFLEPQTVRNTAVLILENEGAYDDFFVYLPALRRARRIAGSQRGDSFFGTDLTYEDVEPKYASDWDATLVGTDEVAGLACHVLDLRPRAGFESVYERMVSCIEPNRATILRTDFHRAGVAFKRLTIDPEHVRDVRGRQIPFRMTLATPRQRSETVVATERYELRPDIPDTMFSASNLEGGSASGDRRQAGDTSDVVETR